VVLRWGLVVEAGDQISQRLLQVCTLLVCVRYYIKLSTKLLFKKQLTIYIGIVPKGNKRNL
jgi:hypothetical protein